MDVQYNIGLWMTDSKAEKLRFFQLKAFLLKHGIGLVHVNDENHQINKEIDVTKLDLVLFKFSDSKWTDDQLVLSRKNFSILYNNSPHILTVDPPDIVEVLTNRIATQNLLESISHSLPRTVHISVAGSTFENGVPSGEDLEYPLICKPVSSSGGFQSHLMSLVFDSSHLKKVLESSGEQVTFTRFVNHGACLHKIFVIGAHIFIFKRPSIRNFEQNTLPDDVISFHTSEVSKLTSGSSLIGSQETSEVDSAAVKSLVVQFVKRTQLSLVGVDVIVDCGSGDMHVIDVNHFPGFEDLFKSQPLEFVFDVFRQILSPFLKYGIKPDFELDDFQIHKL